MDKKYAAVLVIAVVMAIVAVAASIALQAGALFWLANRDDLSWLADSRFAGFTDEQIDAGIVDIPPNFDRLVEHRTIVLGHDINSRTAKDVAAKLLHLNKENAEEPIDLYISTQGGFGDSAFTIIDAIELIDAPVNTWAIGGCYSAGAMILAAGTGTRYASKNSIIMVHANVDDSFEEYSYDRLYRKRYERLFRRNSELPDDWYPMTRDTRYYLSPDEALEFGLVDAIASTGQDEGSS